MLRPRRLTHQARWTHIGGVRQPAASPPGYRQPAQTPRSLGGRALQRLGRHTCVSTVAVHAAFPRDWSPTKALWTPFAAYQPVGSLQPGEGPGMWYRPAEKTGKREKERWCFMPLSVLVLRALFLLCLPGPRRSSLFYVYGSPDFRVPDVFSFRIAVGCAPGYPFP
ncbi:hypothetical protein NDU88_010845 [Pleurodeles waltl]|uniref:Uncharacterized protein n=1 Tax=Pleurodeles waltl TaxID=8319 RepID=A0AAV7QYG7_PLEWA|nr:hypothetical protein NDU88_010845 [Pleurodeles waltl]